MPSYYKTYNPKTQVTKELVYKASHHRLFILVSFLYISPFLYLLPQTKSSQVVYDFSCLISAQVTPTLPWSCIIASLPVSKYHLGPTYSISEGTYTTSASNIRESRFHTSVARRQAASVAAETKPVN